MEVRRFGKVNVMDMGRREVDVRMRRGDSDGEGEGDRWM